MHAADLIVRHLKDAGVRTVFGVPGGGGNLDIIAAAGRAGLPFVLTATETGAAIAALAQTEVTGQAGACITTIGPGVSSVVNGVACAMLERAPVVVITDRLSDDAFEHQRLDHIALMSSITKASLEVTDDNAPKALKGALALATAPPPGPVHLDWRREGITKGTEVAGILRPTGITEGTEVARITLATSVPSVIPSATSKPILITGLGVRNPSVAKAVRDLCERRGIPALVTYKAKGVIPDDHPWFAGVFTNGAIERPIVEQADLIIGVGLDPVEPLPREWAYRAPVIYVGAWPVSDRHVPFSSQLVGDVFESLSALEAKLAHSTWDAGEIRAQWERQQRAICIRGDGMTADTVVETCARVCAASVRVTVDAGAHMFPATMLWPVRQPGDLLISNGLSTMGFALPAAIGAATADRDRRVLALTGDGGLLICAGELQTVVREQLPITTVLFRDDSLSLIEIKQQARRLPASGVALRPMHWTRIAEGFGMPGCSVTDARGLERALSSAVSAEGPTLIEAKIDRSTYGAMLRVIRGA